MPHPMVVTDPLAASPRFYGPPGEIAPDVFMHPAFVNSYALRTPAGLLLVDPGLPQTSAPLHQAVRAWSDAPLATAVYTHGHADHAFGLDAFLAAGDTPAIVAQERCIDRFHRYRLMHGLNARINMRQFGLPMPLFPDRFTFPTLLVRDRLTQRLGDVDVVFTAAKGETDDALWVWVPSRKVLFTGDLVIWQAPNCGNPQKVQRYPEEWADALEAMAGLDAEWLCPGHGLVVEGRAAVRTLLTETARYLRLLVERTRALMNDNVPGEDIVHMVEPDAELATRPFLQATYDHPKFIVRNLLRLWGGWWDGNAAHLLPATPDALAGEVARLAGGVAALVGRARALLDAGDAVLASHLAEWAVRAAADDAAAQALKRDVYRARLAGAESLMARGIFRAAMNDAERALGEEPTMDTEAGMSLHGPQRAR